MMMKQRILTVFMGTLLCASQALAQTKTVTGKVTRDVGVPLSGVSVVVKGTPTVVMAIVFACAPIVNAIAATLMHPPKDGWGGIAAMWVPPAARRSPCPRWSSPRRTPSGC